MCKCDFERRHRFSPFLWTSSGRRSLRTLPSGGFLGRIVPFFGRLRDFFMKGHWFQWPIGRSADEERAPFGRVCPWREGRSRAVGRRGSRWVRLPAVAHSQARRLTRQNSFARQSSFNLLSGSLSTAIPSGRAPETPHRHFPTNSTIEQTRHDHAIDTPTRTLRTWTTPQYLHTNFFLLSLSECAGAPFCSKKQIHHRRRGPLSLNMGAPKTAEQFQASVNSFS